MRIRCIISNKTLPFLSFFFNLQSFNFFINIYPAPMCLRRIILWEIKPQIVACLSLRSHRNGAAQAGRDNPGRLPGAPRYALHCSEKKRKFCRAMKGRWEPLKCVGGPEKYHQRREDDIGGRKRKPFSAFTGSLLAITSHSCLEYFLSATAHSLSIAAGREPSLLFPSFPSFLFPSSAVIHWLLTTG